MPSEPQDPRHPPEGLGRYIVRRNTVEFTDIRWRRSATKHRVARPRSLYVVERAIRLLELPPPADGPDRDPRLLFLGDDREGVALEVIGVEPADRELLLIHAMPVRRRYRDVYEEVNKWQG